MSDILEPSEVDALLAAVDTGKVNVNRDPDAHVEDVVTPYDFARPERVNKDQLQAITALHEGFARNLSANLSGLMRSVVEVSVASVEQLNYAEFIGTLPNPTALTVISASPLPGSFILEMNPTIVFPIIDRMLGGKSDQVVIPDRPLTDIEGRLTTKLVTQSLPLLEEMWNNIRTITFAVTRTESVPQLIQLVPPHEAVVLVTFEVTLGDNSGAMNLCLPYSTIEPIMEQFSTQNWFAMSRAEIDDTHVMRMTKALGGAKLETVAYLAGTTITVRELLELQVGDVIKTGQPADGEATLCVDGKAKFRGRPGRVRRNKAIEITRPLSPGAQD